MFVATEIRAALQCEGPSPNWVQTARILGGLQQHGALLFSPSLLLLLWQVRSQLSEAELSRLVRPSIDWLASLQYPSGNYPSSLGSTTDKLVHWCHGAPGTIHLLLLAFQVGGILCVELRLWEVCCFVANCGHVMLFTLRMQAGRQVWNHLPQSIRVN